MVPSDITADWIQRVVEVESPIHLDEVARRIASAVDIRRIGSRIQNAIKTAAKRTVRSKNIQMRGEFLYWTKQGRITVRDRSELPNVSRKLELIAPEEIEMAIKQIVSSAFGIEQNDLPQETCRLFGLKRSMQICEERLKRL